MIKPAGHRLLIKMEKIEDLDPVWKKAKQAGIVRADHDDAKREQAGVDRGIVLKVGPTAWQDYKCDPWCKQGDLVCFAKYAGKVIVDPEDPETKYIIINDEDVIAVIKEA